MKIENEDTFRHALTHGINLFLGAGFSLLAHDRTRKPLPTGAELAKELTVAFKLKDMDTLELPQLCTIIEHTAKDELRDFLQARYTVGDYDPRYNVLNQISIKTIFTTNIDDLVYKIYADSTTYYLNDLDIRGAAYNDRAAISLITFHGSVVDSNRPFRFSASDLSISFASDPARWNNLAQEFQSTPTLFWGYSLNDAGTLQALHPGSVRGRPHKDKWIMLRPTSPTASVDYFKALGFQIILADSTDMLDYLAGLPLTSAVAIDTVLATKLKKLFPRDFIPAIGTVPVRPLVDFFQGAAPEWSDIFSGQLHETAHANKIRNSINSGHHTLIIGIPASGKTTLLMQVAANLLVDGFILWLPLLTPEKARLLGTNLGGAKAVVFVDNFTDSLEAFEKLASYKNVVVVGADRDYNFEIVRDRIDSTRFNILPVTGLSPEDIQSCLATLPASAGRRMPVDKDMSSGLQPSLFEIVEANLRVPTLKDRYLSALKQLARQDKVLRDILLMVCYCYRCRIPVSMDMMIAYLHSDIRAYTDVYPILTKVGQMITDYDASLVEGDQDYWIARSSIVGEAVLEKAPPHMLRSMLRRFHDNLSSYCICRYDIFRRNAFDHDLFARAFPNPKEGKQFYEDLYSRDNSPYTLQHTALYLSDKKRYTEAFEMIDRAMNESGGHVWSIKNSSAIILFKANYDKAQDPSARRELDRSMQILTECVKWDRRKPFHVLTFADQALKYWHVYGDKRAKKYLETAQHWLIDEHGRSVWNQNVKRLLSIINNTLA